MTLSQPYAAYRELQRENEALKAALTTARHQVNLFARPDDAIAQTVLQVIDQALGAQAHAQAQ